MFPRARPILPRGHPQNRVKPEASSTKKKKKKSKSQKPSKVVDPNSFEMKSSWNVDEFSLVFNNTRHNHEDLKKLPKSLPWTILGLNMEDYETAPSTAGPSKANGNKSNVQRKKKENGVPREMRVFTTCPDCGYKIHVRNVCCPGCRLSKAEIKQRKKRKAKKPAKAPLSPTPPKAYAHRPLPMSPSPLAPPSLIPAPRANPTEPFSSVGSGSHGHNSGYEQRYGYDFDVPWNLF